MAGAGSFPLPRSGQEPASAPPVTGEPLLAVQGLSVRFPTDDGTVDAVRGLSYTVAASEVLALVGESGCGKSTSSLAVMGLLPRSAQVTGRILFEGQDLLALPERRWRMLRGNRIGMVFQDPMAALNPVRTVGDQLAEAVRAHQKVTKKAALAQAAEMLDLVGIPRPAERLRCYPHEFSGGMRQRVMIAMGVVNRPDVIIADEPTSALDVTVQAQILATLLEVKDAVGAAIVLITHDLGAVAGVADRVLVMYAGRPVETGTTDQVFGTPRMPYTAGLLGSIPGVDRTVTRLRPIPGTPPTLIDLPPGCSFSPRCPIAHDSCHSHEPGLTETDHRGHLAACHSWPAVAQRADPQLLFRREHGHEQVVR